VAPAVPLGSTPGNFFKPVPFFIAPAKTVFLGLRGKGCSEVLLKAGRILPEPINTSKEGLIKRVETMIIFIEIYRL
jgi:hypothetical protein